MASQAIKVTVSLSREQFRQMERLRKQLKLSRSALITRALQQLLASGVEPQRGSPEALLPYAGSWVFNANELDILLRDIKQMRQMELE